MALRLYIPYLLRRLGANTASATLPNKDLTAVIGSEINEVSADCGWDSGLPQTDLSPPFASQLFGWRGDDDDGGAVSPASSV